MSVLGHMSVLGKKSMEKVVNLPTSCTTSNRVSKTGPAPAAVRIYTGLDWSSLFRPEIDPGFSPASLGIKMFTSSPSAIDVRKRNTTSSAADAQYASTLLPDTPPSFTKLSCETAKPGFSSRMLGVKMGPLNSGSLT